MTDLAEEAAGRGHQPRALIVTLYGLYGRQDGGWLSVSSIIRLMAELGVDEPAVRSSISRLKRRGLLDAARANSSAGYALSEHARGILQEGDDRIFERPRASVDEGWVLAVFSVPEAEREKRHQLRSRLAWLGFGTVTAGVWIAPAHLEAQAREVLLRAGLDAYVEIFAASYQAFGDVRDRVPQWWDLDRLRELYAEFLDAYAGVLAAYKRRRRVDPAQAFRDYVRALTDWRRLPYSDPGLAVELLPAGWPGVAAAQTFFDLRARLADPAREFVDAVRGGE